MTNGIAAALHLVERTTDRDLAATTACQMAYQLGTHALMLDVQVLIGSHWCPMARTTV